MGAGDWGGVAQGCPPTPQSHSHNLLRAADPTTEFTFQKLPSHPMLERAALCCAHSHHFVQYNLHHQSLHFYSSFIFTHPTEVKRCFSPGKRQHLIPRPPGTQRQDLCSSLLQLAGAPYLEPQSPALIGMRTLYSISLSSCWHCLLVWMLQVTV